MQIFSTLKTTLFFVSILAIAYVAHGVDAEGGLPVGQTTLPDGRVKMNDANGDPMQLSDPDRFKERYNIPPPLDAQEKKECEALAPGSHILENGREIIKFETGEILPLPQRPMKFPVSKTAVQTSPGVWVEPELKSAIDDLSARTLLSVLDSLKGPAGLLGIREIASELPMEVSQFPLWPTQGGRLVHSVIHDMRFDRLLKELSLLSEDKAVAIIESRLEELALEQSRIFDEALARFNSSNHDLTGVVSPERIQAIVESIDSVLYTRADYEESPNRSFAIATLLLLAANLHLNALHPSLQALGELAIAQRDQVYAVSHHPDLVIHLLAHSLYNRQALATALIETASIPISPIAEFEKTGLVMNQGTTVPFDAYSTSALGLANAQSGPGRPYRVVTAITDAALDELIKR